ncbi:uracil-DNA glycosylase [Candidatus Azoamicus ciliaticola]|uniref:Uracil-DNA glycosylase n=1 Tax=Candidatus Azoamicus ciliaticola TaxID=2652803 RepID=A0A6J5JY90_9GAMM|nr:uracil-DNA glycosylase [Candidatus Azoamicus ciliaticola]CAB3976313.1 Uracil-DNA glycosylase [Candidatus Azoamicus ciliaticola]
MIESSWFLELKSEFSKPYFNNLLKFVESERKVKNIYPSDDNIFNCLNAAPYYKVRIVLIGQDPYCNFGQAHGLAFSVLPQCKLPSSLMNIYKELYMDLGVLPAKHGYLMKWANQGILLLNSSLTVEEGKPGSHFNIGWEVFTNNIIKKISSSGRKIIFVLFGKSAFEKIEFINCTKNIVITSAHPSPMSANKGFFGSRPFSKINFNLKLLKRQQINWCLD